MKPFDIVKMIRQLPPEDQVDVVAAIMGVSPNTLYFRYVGSHPDTPLGFVTAHHDLNLLNELNFFNDKVVPGLPDDADIKPQYKIEILSFTEDKTTAIETAKTIERLFPVEVKVTEVRDISVARETFKDYVQPLCYGWRRR